MSDTRCSETWRMKNKHHVKLDRTEVNALLRWMYGSKLKERKQRASLVIKNDRSRRFGHIECKDDVNLVKLHDDGC